MKSQTLSEPLLERVEERDRVILAMLQERIHPDDIAATLGISGAALKRRRARIIARLRNPATAARFSDPTQAQRVTRSARAG